ncbi:hypothetical protein EVAR_43140_1 [Eumeta japonica]|uniref:Uncharacterized protein n=1 Tax=Eumeta variegata TaxID=151549 RepID=A0A4C1XPQ5_EUMVA|nr:hypothetical protein EVAR_43140_1 [Eumeta japonica]
MNNAPHHSIVENKAPTISSKVADTGSRLAENHINFDPTLQKSMLLDSAKKNNSESIFETDVLTTWRPWAYSGIKINGGHIETTVRLARYSDEEVHWLASSVKFNDVFSNPNSCVIVRVDDRTLGKSPDPCEGNASHCWPYAARGTTNPRFFSNRSNGPKTQIFRINFNSISTRVPEKKGASLGSKWSPPPKDVAISRGITRCCRPLEREKDTEWPGIV